jgi:hypothetical protein
VSGRRTGRRTIMCDITESDPVDRLQTENRRLLSDRRRVAGFISSDAWDAMNERRAWLIGRDTDGGLSDAERAELATLQLAVDVLIGVRGSLPDPEDGAWKEAVIQGLQAEVKVLKAELSTIKSDMEAAAGELMVPIPAPGTDAARLLHANVMMRKYRIPELRRRVEMAERERDAILDSPVVEDGTPDTDEGAIHGS